MKENLRRNEPINFENISGKELVEAVKKAIARHKIEIAKIAESTETPNFDNTIAALERPSKSRPYKMWLGNRVKKLLHIN